VDCVNDATDQTFYALARGTVLVAGDDNFASCPGVTGTDGMNTIAIYDEAEGRTHLFLHASAVSVRRDEEVEVGTALGTQGSTGAEGSHVHYEIRNEKTCFAADKTRSANLASYKARNTDPLTWFSGTGASSLPGVPSGLRVVSASRSGILLNWSAVSATTQYRMYRNGVLVASLPGTSFTDAGLTADTAYSYTVAACNATACSGVSSSVAARTDSAQTQLPAAPAIPAVASANESSVSLIWTGVSGASSYWVYRNSTRLVQVSATSYTDTTLAAGTAYQYAVAACSAVGCSAVSPSVTASTQAGRTSVPQVPAGLSTPSVGASNAQLAWTAATGAASYVVYRNGVQIASPSAGSYSDVGLSPTTDYVYTVAACNSAGCSAQGAVLNVRTLAAQIQAPIPPTAPTIAGATASALSLSWQAVTGSSYYRVLRNGQFITTALTTAYLDSGLSAGTAYTYTVAACNAAGCSAASPAGTGATAAQAARVTSITAFNYNVSQARMYSQLLSGNNSVFAVLGTNLPSTALIEVAGLACNIAAPVTATGFAQVGSYSTAPRSYLGAFGATVYNYSSSSGASQGFIAVCQGTAMSRGATYDVHVKDASGGNHITGGYLRATVN
jgi:chitodextrinase